MKTRKGTLIITIGDAIYKLTFEEVKKHWWSSWTFSRLIEKEFVAFDGTQMD